MLAVKLDESCHDVFVGFSSLPGEVSPIDQAGGTIFIQTLTECLQACYKSKPLDQIYAMVTDTVLQKNKISGTANRGPQKISTLKADVFFSQKMNEQGGK